MSIFRKMGPITAFFAITATTLATAHAAPTSQIHFDQLDLNLSSADPLGSIITLTTGAADPVSNVVLVNHPVLGNVGLNDVTVSLSFYGLTGNMMALQPSAPFNLGIHGSGTYIDEDDNVFQSALEVAVGGVTVLHANLTSPNLTMSGLTDPDALPLFLMLSGFSLGTVDQVGAGYEAFLGQALTLSFVSPFINAPAPSDTLGGSFTADGIITIVIPEPASVALLALGGLAMLGGRHRRNA